ncbi:MAG: hypothetical protein ABSH02_11850 [Candidatus Sulfotelmatobacter sp.]
MSLIQVGLADKTGEIDADLLQAAAAALNIQVTRDLTQFWNVQASVRCLPSPTKIPAGVWPIFLVKKLPPGEGGFHMDKHNQPYAEVIASASSAEWTIDASHETLEMLVDPYGNRLQNSTSIEINNGKIEDGTGEFAYLVEACDPCEADDYSYAIQGVSVSDFLTPHFYDPVQTPGTRCSFTGAIKSPRQILPGGYISWVNQQADEVQQLLWVDPGQPPTIQNLGPVPPGMSLREWVDNEMCKRNGKATVRGPKAKRLNKELMDRRGTKRANMESIAQARAKLYR